MPNCATASPDTTQRGRYCAFCEDRYLETPPEKGRIVRTGGEWRRITEVTAETLSDTTAEFRLIPNLFEILSFDYWRLNHGLEFSWRGSSKMLPASTTRSARLPTSRVPTWSSLWSW